MKRNSICKVLGLVLALAVVLVLLPRQATFASETQSSEELFYYTVKNGEATITAVDYAAQGILVVPATLGGYPVTAIAEHAFSDRDDITGVTLPEGITTIGTQAFAWCDRLETVTLPSTLVSVGEEAFAGCYNLRFATYGNGEYVGTKDNPYFLLVALEDDSYWSPSLILHNDTRVVADRVACYAQYLAEIMLNEGLKHIGNFAFEGCPELREITIPASVISMGNEPFHECGNLTGYTVAEGNAVYASDSAGVLYTKDGKTLLSTTRRMEGTYTIPADVTALGEYAFRNAANLDAIRVAEGNPNFAAKDGVLFTKDMKTLLVAPGNLRGSYTVPDTVTTISAYAFADTPGLSELVIPEGVTTIKEYAFAWCWGLLEISLPSSLTELGDYAFVQCDSVKFNEYNGLLYVGNSENPYAVLWYPENYELTEAALHPDTMHISAWAFRYCYELQSIIIPDKVLTVGAEAFYNCSKLQTVEFGSNLRYIGSLAFNNTAISRLTLPDTVSYIGDHAFGGCNDLQSAYLGKSLTYLGEKAFAYCSSLFSVTLPEGLTAIEDSTFEWCSAMTEITIPDTVETIGEWAFYATGIYSAKLGKSVSVIGDYAFYSCGNLSEITIGESVTEIGVEAFGACDLYCVYVSDPSAWCKINFGAGGSPAQNAMVKVLDSEGAQVSDVVLDETVTQIPAYAFHQADITSITIPASVTKIGEYAFYYSPVQTVNMGGGVQTVGEYAFYYCTGLQGLTFSDELEKVEEYAFTDCYNMKTLVLGDKVKAIGDHAASGCYGVKELSLGSCLTELGERVFSGCRGIKEITLPDSLVTMGEYCFYNCSGLTSVKIGSGLKTIPGGSFLNCTGIQTLELSEGLETVGRYAFHSCTGITEVTIPHSVTTIEEYAFCWCASMTRLQLGGGLKTIGASAFTDCTSLQSLVLPDSLTSLGESAFCRNYALESLTIGEGLTEIPAYAFANIGSLKQLTIPGNITAIGEGAFYGCGVTNLNISHGVTDIGKEAFFGSASLTRAYIPATVTAIGEAAFGDCSALSEYAVAADNTVYSTDNLGVLYDKAQTKLIALPYAYEGNYALPATVTDIGDGFGTCTQLTGVFVQAGSTAFASDAQGVLFDKDMTTLIFAPRSLSGSYTVPETVTKISDYAFASCSQLTEITLPAGLTYIGERAFYGCSALVSLSVPDSLLYLGYSAFEGCDALTKTLYEGVYYLGSSENPYVIAMRVENIFKTTCTLQPAVRHIYSDAFRNSYMTALTLPDGLRTIGDYAFAGAGDLKTMTIPDSVTYLGRNAFERATYMEEIHLGSGITELSEGVFMECRFLTSFVVPDTITAIGANAFLNCVRLESVVIPDTVTSLGEGIFESCDVLTSVTIGKGVTEIPASAFKDCTGLKEIVLPEGITTIGAEAFYGCRSLESITLPVSLQEIETGVFINCWSPVYCYNGNEDQWAEIKQDPIDYIPDWQVRFAHYHNYQDVTAECIAVTCETDGLRVAVCECGKRIEEVLTATGHDMQKGWGIIPTCYDGGKTPGVACGNCGLVEKAQEDVPALGHTFDNYVSNNDATCTKNGTETARCVRCNHPHTREAENSALGHHPVTNPGYAATCEKPGMTDGAYCDNCNEVLVEMELIPALEHSFENGICSVCGAPDRLPGDLDGDGTVTTDDVIKLLLYISMPDMFPLDAPADFDNSGAVDTDDAIKLLLHLSMPDLFPL